MAGRHSGPAWGRPLPSRSSLSLFSLTATPLGLQDRSHHDTQTGFGSPDLCGSQRVRVVSRRVSDPGTSACPPVPSVAPGATVLLPHRDGKPVETRTESQTWRPRPWLASPIVSSHQLPHTLADVHRLDLLGLEAEIAGPDGRGLGGQQPVGALRHAGALPVEPLLAGSLTQDGVLVIVHLAATGAARIHQARGRLRPRAPTHLAGGCQTVGIWGAPTPPTAIWGKTGLIPIHSSSWGA